MRMPNFTAEASLSMVSRSYINSSLTSVLDDSQVAYPALLASPPIKVENWCPPGLFPRLVKTGGERICTSWLLPICRAERCWGARCLSWVITPTGYHWECQLATNLNTVF